MHTYLNVYDYMPSSKLHKRTVVVGGSESAYETMQRWICLQIYLYGISGVRAAMAKFAVKQ